ncbi:hypothetical protein V9T40_006118 [Parthenolecanium corni]|uniref:Uncharacterized protein n=1 Tax=Parthenolecanium corni TaxID=536013 RepID=A0AAN9TW73_9HEMI
MNSLSELPQHNCGRKVRSLKFLDCDVEASILIEILNYCPNVNEFSGEDVIYKVNDVDVWEMLLDNNVILKNVTSLVLLRSFRAEFCSHEALAQVCPNVLELSICHRFIASTTLEFTHSFLETCNYILKLSPNLQYLELGIKVELADIEDYNHPDRLVQESITRIFGAIKRIKTLHLHRIPFLTEDNLRQLSGLKNLTTFHFNARGFSLSVCDLIVKILDHVPKLLHLKVTKATEFGQNDAVGKKLVTSSLQTLVIETDWNYEPCIRLNEFTLNHTLHTLRLNRVVINPEAVDITSIIMFFIQHFRKLRCISLGNYLASTILKDIGILQKNLTSLAVTFDADSSTDPSESNLDGYAGPQMFPVRQFECLKYLDLWIDSSFSKLYSFSNFVLPNLESLKVTFLMGLQSAVEYMNFVNFLHAIEKLPCLKSLQLYVPLIDIPYNLVLRQCKSHNNLRYLRIINRNYESRQPQTHDFAKYAELSDLFNIRESLRCVSYRGLSLFRNIITKEFQMCKDSKSVSDFNPYNEAEV